MSRVFDDANSEYLERISLAHVGEPLTVCGWFRFDATPDDEQVVIGLFDASAIDNNVLKVDTTIAVGDRIEAQTRGASLAFDTTGTPTVNTWHHAVGRYATGSSREAGLDGTMSGSPNTTAETVTDLDTVAVGSHRGSAAATDFFSGELFWCAVWDHPTGSAGLSSDSITRLANGVEPVFVQRSELISYIRLQYDEDYDMLGGAMTTSTKIPTTDATWTGDVLTITMAAHQFKVGDSVITTDLAPAELNATFTVTVADATTVGMALTPEPTITGAEGFVAGTRLANAPSNDFPNTMIRALPRGRGRGRHRFT